MHNITKILILGCIVFCSLNTISIVKSDYIIQGNRVYIDNQYAYISLTPHTLNESGFIIVDAISKQYTGLVDVAFGFNTSNCKPVNCWLWINNNWQKINKLFDKHNIMYQNYDTWYILKEVNMQKNVLYRLRIELEINYGKSGKYFMGIKRSIDPISKGYYIDPWYNSAWKYVKKITIDHTQIPFGLKHFPVLINLSSDGGLSAYAQNDGGDIVFVKPDNVTKYYHEIEYFVKATGQLVAWVNITHLSSISDTIFYMYYGNPICNNQQYRKNTWSRHMFLAVYHMDSVRDSCDTWNLTASGSPTVVKGRIGKAYNFIEANTDFLYHLTFMDSMKTAFSLQIIYNTNVSEEQGLIDHDSISGSDRFRYRIVVSTGVYPNFFFEEHNHGNENLNGQFFSLNTWQFGSVSFKSGEQRLYANGSMDATNSGFSNIQNGTYTDFHIGREVNGATEYFEGRIDEVRIYKRTINYSWAITCYNTMFNATNNSFFTISGELLYNTPPYVNATNPVNKSINQPLTFIYHAEILDNEGNSFSWNIWCSSGDSSSGIGTNGTKNLSLAGLLPLTNYTVWVNSSNGGGYYNPSNSSRFWFITRPPTSINYPPRYRSLSPINNTSECPCCLVLCVNNISDNDSMFMNITFRSNLSGTWQIIEEIHNVTNGSYCVIFCDFNIFNWTYWWNVSVDDGNTTVYSSNFTLYTDSVINCTNVIDAYNKTESDNMFLGAVFNIESGLLFLLIALGLWIFFITQYMDKRNTPNSGVLGIIQFVLCFPLLIILSTYVLSYPYGFIIVAIIPILSIILLIDAFFSK